MNTDRARNGPTFFLSRTPPRERKWLKLGADPSDKKEKAKAVEVRLRKE
jgi:hypothetical protein